MNDDIDFNPVRYFLATPLIYLARVLCYISTIIAGFPIILLDFSTLEVVEVDFDEEDES